MIMHYAWQITEALTFMHAHGIVHQDVKPENLLLGDSNEVLVSDFGTVAFIQQTGQQNAQACIGTPGYMAPERFTDDAPTPASDIYSLAVVVFEWLTGEALFSGSTPEIIRKHRFAIPSTKRMTTLGVAPALQRVLLKALAKNPPDRYQNVREFYTALVQAASVPDQPLMVDEQRAHWEKMSYIFMASLAASAVSGIGLYLLGVKAAIDVLVALVCLILLPLLSALLCKNWVAVRLALVIPVVAALPGLLLHSWLVFWCLLPISLLFCALIGLLRG